MVLVEVSIPEVAARKISRSHRRNQTIGAHGFRKPTVLKRTDHRAWILERPGEPRRPSPCLTCGQFMVPAVSRLMRCMGSKKEAGGGWDGMTKRIYLRPRITCNHMHMHTHTSLFPWTLPLSGLLALTRLMPPTPAISPRFLGSQDRVPIELLFLLKIKSDSRPDPGDRPGFPLGGVHPTPFYPFLISTATSPSLSRFFSAGPGPGPGPEPSCTAHLLACTHMTC